jgi:gas vesicle protein
MLSLSGAGQTLGTSAAIIAAFELTPGAGPLLKIGKGLTKLVGAYEMANKSKKVLDAASKVYNNTLKSGKYGKFFAEVAEGALKAEMAGNFYGATEGELNATIGAAGVVGSELLGGILSKIPKDKVLPYLSSIFGSSTPQAVSVLGRAGQFATTGIAETGGETLEELAGIYTDENRKNGFFDAVKEKFPDFDAVQEFVTSTIIMGGVFSLTSPNKARELYDALPENKKEQINSVVSDVNNDFQEASNAVEDLADEIQDTEERKKSVDEQKEEKKETKKEEKPSEESDDIIFEVGDIIEYNEWLLGWCLKLNVYRWQVVSKEEIDKQPDVFEEVK